MEGHDDYSLSRVPLEGKQATWKVTIVRLGGISCVPTLMVGAALGYGMTFWDGIIAVFFGSVILQVVGWAIGTAAAREGLSTSLLSRWTGFGNIGSALIGVVIAIACFGWFGIQNTVFAQGIFQATGVFNLPVWTIITGLAVTLIVVYGFKLLSLTANIAFPLFVLAVLYAFAHVISGFSLSELIVSAPPGPALPMATAITMVAGGYMMGAVVTPDMSRFVRNGKDVFWMCLISTFVGELGFCLMAILMTHAVKSSDIVTIMLSLSGWLGAGIVLFSTIKINDINLYSATLGVTNLFDSLFKVKFNRASVTIVVGIIGTILSLLGILNYFISFLIFLGVLVPPIGGIMVVDYFFLKRHRQILDESRAKGAFPEKVEIWNPISILAWIAGTVCGYTVTSFGVPSLNSLVCAGLVYYLVTKLYGAMSNKPAVEFETTQNL